MQNNKFDRKAATLSLASAFAYPSPFSGVARAETTEEAAAAFGSAMAAGGLTGKDGYLDVRDRLRAALRQAEEVQRARRAEEVRIRDAVREGQNDEGRQAIYEDRIWDRRDITALIAIRRAGKAWSAARRRKEAAASVA